MNGGPRSRGSPPSSAARRTGILRAEIISATDPAPEITCALELTEETVFVITDALPSLGTTVTVRLSLSHIIAPVLVTATVEQVRLASGPGTPSGFVGRFVGGERAELRALVERLSPSSPPPIAARARRETSVLLVEGNMLVRDMFAYAVEKYFATRDGSVVLEQAEDVATGWERLHARAYDFAIVDYHLRDGDGASLIRRIRADRRFARMSVIAISVDGTDARIASLHAGADIFLRKPIVLRDLFHTLEFFMREHHSGAGKTSAGAA